MDMTGNPLGLIILMLLYLIPALVAHSRHHHQAGAITVLNLLLGWSILGWVGALVWASTAVRKPPVES